MEPMARGSLCAGRFQCVSTCCSAPRSYARAARRSNRFSSVWIRCVHCLCSCLGLYIGQPLSEQLLASFFEAAGYEAAAEHFVPMSCRCLTEDHTNLSTVVFYAPLRCRCLPTTCTQTQSLSFGEQDTAQTKCQTIQLAARDPKLR